MPSCPWEAKLPDYLDDRLNDKDRQTLEAHVDSCQLCEEKLAHLTSDMDETGAKQKRPPQPARELPERLGRYRIIQRLGRGGMGAVYLAHDTELDREVALKVPHLADEETPEVLGRFRREARAAATIEHPNLCTVHDVGEIDGIHYLTMAYIDGPSLLDTLSPLALDQYHVAAIVRKLARALAEAHQKGVIHRDLKPGNIMINRHREPVIVDFGLAHWTEASGYRLTQSGQITGTPAYMAPEQFTAGSQSDTPSVDIYSLGVILYQLLTGQIPFRGTAYEIMGRVINSQPKPPSQLRRDLDPRLEAICLKAMAKQPAGRYLTMADFADALQELIDEKEVSSHVGHAPVRIKITTSSEDSAVDSRVVSNESRVMRPVAVAAEAQVPTTTIAEGPPTVRGRRFGWLWIAAGLSLLGVLATVITIVTNNGTLEIKVLDEDVKVQVAKNGRLVTIVDTKANNQATLRAGEYELQLVEAQGPLTLSANRFTLKRGETEIIEVRRISGPRKAHDDEQTTATAKPESQPGFQADYATLAVGSWQPVFDTEDKVAYAARRLTDGDTAELTQGALKASVTGMAMHDHTIQARDMILRAKIKRIEGHAALGFLDPESVHHEASVFLEVALTDQNRLCCWRDDPQTVGSTLELADYASPTKYTDFFELTVAAIREFLLVYVDGKEIIRTRRSTNDVLCPALRTPGGSAMYKQIEVQVLDRTVESAPSEVTPPDYADYARGSWTPIFDTAEKVKMAATSIPTNVGSASFADGVVRVDGQENAYIELQQELIQAEHLIFRAEVKKRAGTDLGLSLSDSGDSRDRSDNDEVGYVVEFQDADFFMCGWHDVEPPVVWKGKMYHRSRRPHYDYFELAVALLGERFVTYVDGKEVMRVIRTKRRLVSPALRVIGSSGLFRNVQVQVLDKWAAATSPLAQQRDYDSLATGQWQRILQSAEDMARANTWALDGDEPTSANGNVRFSAGRSGLRDRTVRASDMIVRSRIKASDLAGGNLSLQFLDSGADKPYIAAYYAGRKIGLAKGLRGHEPNGGTFSDLAYCLPRFLPADSFEFTLAATKTDFRVYVEGKEVLKAPRRTRHSLSPGLASYLASGHFQDVEVQILDGDADDAAAAGVKESSLSSLRPVSSGKRLLTLCLWVEAARRFELVNTDFQGEISRIGQRGLVGRNPAWSPDGTRLAYEHNNRIYVTDSNGNNPVPLADDDVRQAFPSWSSDGKRIVLAHGTDAVNRGELFIFSHNGQERERISTRHGKETWPAWSPDGRQIAFRTERNARDSSLCVMNADGTYIRSLSVSASWWACPTWSPDGHQICCVHSQAGEEHLFLLDADGVVWRRITEDGEANLHPTWSSDGKHIAYAHYSKWPTGGSKVLGDLRVYDVGAETHYTILAGRLPQYDARPAWKPIKAP